MPACRHAGQHAAHPRHRALGGPRHRQPARRPRHRHQSRQRRDRLGQARSPARTSSAAQEEFFTAPLVADGKVLVQNGAGDGGTRGWVAALDVKTGNELWRFYTVPKPGDPGQRDLEGRSQRVEDRRRRHLADRLLRSGDQPLHRRHRQPVSRSTIRSSARATTCTRTRRSRIDVATGKLAWHFQYTPNDSWDFDEVGVHMLYDVKIDGVHAQGGRATTRATASSTPSIAPTAASSRPRSTSTI